MKTKNSKSSRVPLTDTVNVSELDRIRQRAYELWETRGYPHGRDLEHWLQAEREISAIVGQPPEEC